MQPAEAVEMEDSSAVPGAGTTDSPAIAITQRQRETLLAQFEQARARLDALAGDLRAIDDELDALATDRKRHRLLLDACISLDELTALGGAHLFWGDSITAGAGLEHISRVRGIVDAFDKRIGEIEGRRHAVIDRIKEQQSQAGLIEDDLFDVQEEEERLRQEWIVEREIEKLPARKAIMPWTRGGEDDKRFRKSLASALIVSVLFALIVPLIDLPPRLIEEEAAETPERLVRLMEERRRPPPPPTAHEVLKPKPKEQLVQQKPEPQPSAQPDKAEPAPADKGLLAFRDQFSSLRQASLSPKLGRQARISTSDENTAGRTERSMLTKLGPGSSGGINLAGLSRDVGGGGGAIQGVQVARVSSGVGGSGSADRPLSGAGPGLGRTDEEIQIVFDRYKAALYRLYNRELRKDPTLRGQMVLHLTIEPNGGVSFCQLKQTDMNAPELATQVVDRVKTFDFGAKDVAAITILYPIDFLPAA